MTWISDSDLVEGGYGRDLGHRPGDPPVPDLSEWDDIPGGKPGAFHLRCEPVGGPDTYSYFIGRAEDGRYQWMCGGNRAAQWSQFYTTAEEALADLRKFHAEEIEGSSQRQQEVAV